MGLDMYARKCKLVLDKPVDFFPEDRDNMPGDTELHYWRKHPNMHGWMQRLYNEKGGTDADFDMVPVQLTVEDLDRLQLDVEGEHLPDTSGFFFGESVPSEDKPGDLEFIEKAREAIKEGFTVYYYAWW